MKKKILFISPVFFGYYKEIIEELQKQDYEVDYFKDMPSNSNITKAIGRINRNFIRINVNNYFNKTIMPVINKKEYDYVFIIVGMTFSFFPNMIKKIKKNNLNAKFILYQWDGEKNIKFVKKIHKFFEKIYTFDRLDSLKDSKYSCFPLFYTRNYENVGKREINDFKYDVSYIGTAHPQKIKMINEMSEKIKSKFDKQFIYHYMPSKFKFYYHKLFAKEYKDIGLKDLKMEKLLPKQTMKIFEESKCILDAPQKGQNGLTIRTIECLGAKRKLITTNKDIINYDFYNNTNILIYNGNIDYNSNFFLKPYQELPKEIYEEYALRNWLKRILQ